MSQFRRPTPHQNGSTLPSILDDLDRWTIPEPPEILLPTDEALLLRQLLTAQKEQLVWAQRTAVMVREIRDMPFWSLVKLFVKAAFAAIPAAIIIAVIWAIINAVITGSIAVLAALLLSGASRGIDAQPTPIARSAVAAPASTPINEDAAYVENLRGISKDFIVVVDDMDTLLKYAGNDRTLLMQPEWNEKIKAVYRRYRDTVNRIRTTQPPLRFQKSHGRWLEFATYLENAVNAMEASNVSESTIQLGNAQVAMGAAVREMNAAAP